MWHTRQGPRWWSIGLPLLGLGGLLVLEHQALLSPGGHQVAEIAMALLMYGGVVCWLWYNRGALVHQEYERERAAKARQPRQEPIIYDDEPWDDSCLPWQSNEPDTDIHRRQ